MEAALSMQETLYGFEMREPDLRRTNREGTHDIKQLWQRSHEILGLLLQGYKQVEIAEMLNVHPVTVSNVANSKLGKEKLSKMRSERDEEFIEVSKEVSRLAEKAIKVYEEIFDNDTVSFNLKKETADTVLMDLGGHRAPTKVDTRSFSMTASMEEINEFKKRGLEAAKAAGMLVEVPGETKVLPQRSGGQAQQFKDSKVEEGENVPA